MRVGNEVQDIVVKLKHRRSIFGEIVGESGKLWEDYRAEGAESGAGSR